jgi:4-amino-4-deoxy-L-arabinose transferase-like glycosyltransferase
MITSGRTATANVSSAAGIAAAFAVVLFVVLFFRLGAASFWDPDEAHYAETTRELLDTGDWLAPYYNEQPFFDKPILFHWLQGAAMALLGENELGARLVPALAALALVGVTAWFGASLLSRDVALMAALLLATSPAVFALARYAILDSVFTLMLFGGASFVTVSALHDRPRLQWYGYVAIALAVLVKGPLALLLCALPFGLTLVLSSEARRRLLGLRFVSGVILVVVLAAPWFVYMGFRFRDAFVNGYLLDENIRLYAADRFTPTASSSVWFYFRVLGAGLLPWTGVVVGRLYDDVRAAWKRDGSLDVVDVLLWSWTLAIVAFFTFSRFKLDHYVFPAAPALCLLCARAWVGLRDNPDGPRYAGVRIGYRLVGPLLLIVAIVAAYMLIARLALPAAALVVPAAIAGAGVALTLDATSRPRRMPKVPWAVFGALTMTYAGLLLWVIPALEDRKVMPDLARWVAARASAGDRVATYRLNRWNTAYRFYVGRHVSMIDAPDEALALFKGTEEFYCTMPAQEYDAFVASGAPLRVVYEREGMWATSGRVLWKSRVELARFVVAARANGP